jgi:GNAT superfamily N-acetyltransferase
MATQSPVEIRPMDEDDVAEAEAVSWAAMRELWPAEFRPDPADEPIRSRRARIRVAHLLETDPGGAFVATGSGGAIVGAALAIARDGMWGLSLLAVDPGHQAAGIGVRLLAAALDHAPHSTSRLILSSVNPRALRAYHRAGLRARPCLEASGPLNRSRIPTGLRSVAGDPGVDADVITRASRHVRGASHLPDIEAAMEAGCELLVCGDGGFALARDGAAYLVAALDEASAIDLAWSCLALGGPGEPAHIGFISAGNDWAIGVALDAGLSLAPDGPVFASGPLGTMTPYLPSGAYL